MSKLLPANSKDSFGLIKPEEIDEEFGEGGGGLEGRKRRKGNRCWKKKEEKSKLLLLFHFVLTTFSCFFLGSLGSKYFTLVNYSPGTFYIGTQKEILKSGVTANQVQVAGSPVLQQLRQNQFSFDMELCDGVAMSTGSFVVADETAPKSGVLLQCFKRPENAFDLVEVIAIMTTNMIYEQLFKNKVSMSS
ncbi:uncharacterized protein LOC125660068 [Ostrea edulis]|uniref:uncharacterized protein LOC125660068 n=1 Tax=Ostrea edulis TaxID=37623 RepID=UPI0024AECDA8|nr:uncharacterized protein LOC125660068 [Ostrea edulis]